VPPLTALTPAPLAIMVELRLAALMPTRVLAAVAA
jgi:hypothetical protein